VVKKKVIPPVEILEKMKPLLEKFKEVVHDEIPTRLPPMRGIQHHILKANLPNFLHYQKNSRSSKGECSIEVKKN